MRPTGQIRRGNATLALVFSALILSLSNAHANPIQENGINLYKTRCAVCHGERGDGAGPAAPSLYPKPADFTSGYYKYRSTPWGAPPLDSDLERTIRQGLNGTAMPAWNDILTSEEVATLVDIIKSFSPSMFSSRPVSIQIINAPRLIGSEEEGKKLYQQKGCIQCHGTEGRGDGPLSRQINDYRGERSRPRDLTDYRNYRLGATPEEIYLRIATGLNGTPMAGYADKMSMEEMVDLSAYLKMLYQAAERNRWTETAHQEPIDRGEYLTRAMNCQLCHTPVNPDFSYKGVLRFAGGIKLTSYPDGIFYSRNLTPDLESGLGNWNINEIKVAITHGTSKNGRLLYPFDMPWLFFSNLSDQDVEAIAIYLKSLQPIYNKIPPPDPSGFWASFWNKILLIFGRERTVEYHIENSGETDPQKGGTILPAENGFWSIFPPMGWISVEKIIKAARPDLPLPATSNNAIENAKRMHGRYLVSIAPCAMCHTAVNGGILLKPSEVLSGGLKISCKCFGTVYSKNLTPDKTGLESWTEEQIKRAIKSGITKDGRLMHWQAMPWDIFSNFTESDLEAIVAYLKNIPPVQRSIPPNLPDAPQGYIIYLGKDYGVIGKGE